jgi:type II secretory pathway pseudopilin PulG
MIVATTIMGIAVAGLMSGISSTTRNAARLRDYDRVVQLARFRMDSLLADTTMLPGGVRDGVFDPAITGGLECGWRAQISLAEAASTPPGAGDWVLDRVQVEVWWMSGRERRTFQLESYRRRKVRPEDPEAPR